jgi:hypothetical protein
MQMTTLKPAYSWMLGFMNDGPKHCLQAANWHGRRLKYQDVYPMTSQERPTCHLQSALAAPLSVSLDPKNVSSKDGTTTQRLSVWVEKILTSHHCARKEQTHDPTDVLDALPAAPLQELALPRFCKSCSPQSK